MLWLHEALQGVGVLFKVWARFFQIPTLSCQGGVGGGGFKRFVDSYIIVLVELLNMRGAHSGAP